MVTRILVACAVVPLVVGLAGCKGGSESPTKGPTSTSSAPGDPPGDPPNIDAGKLLDQTKLPDLKGTTKALSEYSGKKGLMIVFVDIKCPFSGTALKDMPAMVKTLQGHDISTVLINNEDPKDAVEKTYGQTDLGAPIVYDTTPGTLKAWEVNTVPLVVFVTADKKLVYYGPATWQDLATSVEKSLGLTPGSIPVPAKGTGGG